MWNSCSKEQEEIIEELEQKIETRVSMSPQEEIEEAMEWWKDREGAFAGPYEYYIEVQAQPYEENRNLGLDYPGYLNIRWNYNYPVCNNPKDYYMQIQYKLYQPPFPGSGWKYLGEEGPARYYYGIVSFSPEQKPLSLNAAHFPYGSIAVRYRFIHKDFPGPIIDPEATNKYDLNLASKWQCEYSFRSVQNPYGFGAPEDPEGPKEPESSRGSIVVTVEFPFQSFNDNTYSYSYEIVNSADIFIEHISGSVNSMNIGKSKIIKKKDALFGYFTVNATRKNNHTDICDYLTRTVQYSQSDTYITVTFSESDFPKW